MTRSSKEKILASSVLLATLGTAAGFRGTPIVQGRAAAIRLKQAADRTASTSSSTRTRQDKTATCMVLGFADGLFSGIFSGPDGDPTCLPQDPNADTEARAKELKQQQRNYEWRREGTPIDMPYLEGFPPAEETPAVEWLAMVGRSLVRTLLGAVRGTIDIGEVIEALTDPEKAATFAATVEGIIENNIPNQRPVDLNDYNDLHAFPIKTPESVYDFEEDDAFARQRLQGANCVTIKKCTQEVRAKLKILDQDDSYAGLKKSVDSLLAEGKLFVVDHELLEDHTDTTLLADGTRKYLAKGIALFEMTDDELLPIRVIGIQLTQGKTVTPIFTPADGYSWKIATAAFEASDFIIHEATQGTPNHALLAPHFEGTALINWGAHNLLMAEGGEVDKLTANKIEDSRAMVKSQTLKRISSDFSPEADFAARGVTKEDFPGRYMYRDYGLKYWDATHTWVKEYLDSVRGFACVRRSSSFTTSLKRTGTETSSVRTLWRS
eukprot:g13709.t1